MSRLVFITPYNYKRGRHIWENSWFEDMGRDWQKVSTQKAEEYLKDLYAQGQIDLDELLSEVVWIDSCLEHIGIERINLLTDG